MEPLLPSDIARLVYGYLTEEKCDAAAQLFLETSDHLKECNNAHKKGRKFITKILGLCLVDVLNLFTDAVCMLKNYREKQLLNKDLVSDKDENASLIVELNNVLQELSNVLLINDHSDKSKQKTVFVRISIPQRNKSSSSHDSPDKKEAEKMGSEKKENEKKKEQGITDESFESTTIAKNVSSNLDDFDVNMMQTLLDNTALHERIAENINKAIDSSGEVNNAAPNEKQIVETVLHSTEADPIFEELLHMLAVPRNEDTTTPEDTDKEGGDPAEKRRQIYSDITPEEEEAMKKLEEDNNLAIEGILAGNKTMQEQAKAVTPQDLVENVGGEVLLNSSPSSCFPVPITTSTPLQPMITGGITTLVGILSPVPSRRLNQTLYVPVKSLSRVQGNQIIRGRPSRPIPILPKTSDMEPPPAYQIQAVRDSISKPRVRTRGGLQKGTTRGVKSIAPQITQTGEGTYNVTFSEKNYLRRTRSMNKTTLPSKVPKLQQIQEEESAEITIIDLESSNESEIEKNAQIPSEKSTLNNSVCLPNLHGELHNSLPEVETEKTTPSTESSTQTNEKELQLVVIPEPPDDVEENLSTKLQSVTKVNDNVAEIALKDKEIEKSNSSTLLVGNGITDKSTPDQQNLVAKFKKRISLSTPRRGSHIRALDFKTPEKPLNSRKSLTSPKEYAKTQKIDLKIEKAKRGILKSPEYNFEDKNKELTKLQQAEKIKTSSKNDWDADLRKFMDIPTCVGLKRKTAPKKEPKRLPRNQVRRKSARNVKKKDPKQNGDSLSALSPTKSSDDLIEQIEKDVRDVINEEELSIDPSLKNVADNINDKPLDLENVNKSRTSSCSENMVIDENENDNELLPESLPINNMLENQSSEVQKVVPPFEKSVLKSGVSLLGILDGNTRENMITVPDDNIVDKVIDNPENQKSIFSDFAATPLKEATSPSKEDIVTPTTKLILSQLVVNFSPNSQSSSNLESILIKEGTRLEQEIVSQASQPDNAKLLESVEAETQTTNISKSQITNKSSADEIKRHIPVECVVKQFVPQTPAKFLTSHLPLGFPVEATPIGKIQPGLQVEMTPLSKVLHSETKYLSTAIVTPTLPATPKPRDDKSPNRTDSLISNTSENEYENNTVQLGKQLGIASDKDNPTEVNGMDLSDKESITNSIKVIETRAVARSRRNLKTSTVTPRVRLSPRERKQSTVNKTQRKRNVRRISSSSDSQEGVNVSEIKKSVLPKDKNDDIAQNNEINSIKKNISKPKQRIAKLISDGSKPLTKSQKISPNKKQSQFDLMRKEEEVLKECLEKAKARTLFGFISSDSDSSDDVINELSGLNNVNITKVQDPPKPELQHAYNRLKQINSTSMLLSSSSSDDEDFNLNSTTGTKISTVSGDLISKCDLPKSISKFSDGIPKASSTINQNLISESKKLDSPKKTDKLFKDIAKSISREKEESCESFPALYLSEESNMSGISDSHNVKFMKSKKSPTVSCDNILLKKATLSSSGVSPQPKTNLYKSSSSKQTQLVPIPQTQPSTKEEIKDHLDTYERVIHSSTNTLNSISVKDSQELSEYLDDYIFSFTLGGEGRGVMSKTLKTGPFFSIFEMSPERELAVKSNPSPGGSTRSPESERLCTLETVSPVARRVDRQRSWRGAISPLPGAKRCERGLSPQRDRQKSGRDVSSPIRQTTGTVRSERCVSPQRDRQKSGRDISSPIRQTTGTVRPERCVSPQRDRQKRDISSPIRQTTGTVRSERCVSPQRDRQKRDISSPIRQTTGTVRSERCVSPQRDRQKRDISSPIRQTTGTVRSERCVSPQRDRQKRDISSPIRQTTGTVRSERCVSPQRDRQKRDISSPIRQTTGTVRSERCVSPQRDRQKRDISSPIRQTTGTVRSERCVSPQRDRQKRDISSPIRQTTGTVRSERCVSPQRDRQKSGRDISSPIRQTTGTVRSERCVSPQRDRQKSGRDISSPIRLTTGTVRSERCLSPQRDRQRSGRDVSSPIRHTTGTVRSERGLSPQRDRQRSGRDNGSPTRHTSGTVRPERGLSPPLDRQRKRQRSDSSSDDDRRKYMRYPGSARRDYKGQSSRRNKVSSKKPKFYSRFPPSPRYPIRNDTYRRQRHHSPESNKRPHKMSSNEHKDRHFNDSFKSSRSSESDRLLIEQSFRSSELSDSPHKISRVPERTHHSFTESQIMKKKIPSYDREDGELSDTSGFHTANTSDQDAVTEAKRKELIALMSDDSRANLLKKVDLDSFLTMLHGAEKKEK